MSQTAQFECGCWFHNVGVIRHPAITGTMCCPIHLKPYPRIAVHFAMLTCDNDNLSYEEMSGTERS